MKKSNRKIVFGTGVIGLLSMGLLFLLWRNGIIGEQQ